MSWTNIFQIWKNWYITKAPLIWNFLVSCHLALLISLLAHYLTLPFLLSLLPSFTLILVNHSVPILIIFFLLFFVVSLLVTLIPSLSLFSLLPSLLFTLVINTITLCLHFLPLSLSSLLDWLLIILLYFQIM